MLGNENPAAHRATKGKQGDTALENLLLPLATCLMAREVGLLVGSALETSKEGIFAASTEVEEGLAVLLETRGPHSSLRFCSVDQCFETSERCRAEHVHCRSLAPKVQMN